MNTFKILGLLLTYPEGTVYSASDDMMHILRSEALLPQKHIKQINAFLQHQKNADLIEVQEDYVKTFDQGRAHCLHLFEHVHGESRERGQAMVDLVQTYAGKSLQIYNNELPDYLPLFMEYLSICPLPEATELLAEAIDVIALIGSKLEKRKSPYAAVFLAMVALSAIKPDKIKIRQALDSAPEDPKTFEELDEQWQEAAAFSGDPVADCSHCDIAPQTAHTQYVKIGGVQ